MFNKCGRIIKTLILIAVVSLAILVLPVYIAGEEPRIVLRTGQIVNVVGEVDIKKAGENLWMEASCGTHISQYDMIKTREEASVDIEFTKKDGKYFKIRLLDESELSFTRVELDSESTIENILLDLTIGDVLIKTDKFDPKSKFRVRTPTSMIGVRGTRFEVVYEKAQ